MSEHVRVPEVSRGRKRRSSEALRNELLDSATQLFARHGVESVNSNQIARGAGVGVGSFYNQFKDKWEIQQAVMLRTLEGLRDHLGRGAAPASAPVETQVRALVDSVLSFALERPEAFRVAFSSEAPARRPAPGGEGGPRPQVGYSTRVTERRLEELQRAGRLDPAIHPAVAARAFVAMQNAVVCWWLDDPSRASREEVGETLVRLHPAIAARLD